MRVGALNAVATRRRFAGGGSPDEDDATDLDMTNAVDQPSAPVPASAASPAAGAPRLPTEAQLDAIRRQRDAQQGPGPLNNQWLKDSMMRNLGTTDPAEVSRQQGALEQQKRSAFDAKRKSIEDARNILAQVRMGQSANLPMLAFAQGMLAPTRTGGFSEGLSHGLGAAIPQVQAQRTEDLKYGQLNANLGIAASDVDLAATQDASKDFLERLKMQSQAETWGARTETQRDVAATRARSADYATSARYDAALQRVQSTADWHAADTDAKKMAVLERAYRDAGVQDQNERKLLSKETIDYYNAKTRRLAADKAPDKSGAVTAAGGGPSQADLQAWDRASQVALELAKTGGGDYNTLMRDQFHFDPVYRGQKAGAATPGGGKPSIDDIFKPNPAAPPPAAAVPAPPPRQSGGFGSSDGTS